LFYQECSSSPSTMAYSITRSFNDRTSEAPMEPETDRLDVSEVSFLSAPLPQVAERIRRQPECRLLWAVLEDGRETYMKYATATGRRGKRPFAEAERRIMADDSTWLCSLVSLCHILGLEPDYLRAGLKRWRMRTSAPALLLAA
jgi:hypothetical protein